MDPKNYRDYLQFTNLQKFPHFTILVLNQRNASLYNQGQYLKNKLDETQI